MKYVIVYWSRYGNGKLVVETLANKLKKKKAETHIMTTDEANPVALPDADIYIFSAPAEAFNVQRNMRSFLKKIQGMDQKKYGIINTHGMDRNWLGKMEKLLSKKNMEKVAGIDFKVGKEANSGNALMNGWENELDTFIEKISSK
jgi:flavodoxin